MKRIPQQAEVNKFEAEGNIDRKLNILQEWLAKGIPYCRTEEGFVLLDENNRKQLDFYPTSLRKFKAWNGSQNCVFVRNELPFITATGNDTLAKRPDKAEQARRLIEALRQRASAQITETSASEVQRLTAELAIAQATINIRNAELREQQRRLRRIERENARLAAKMGGDAAEFKTVYAAMQAQLDEQRRENAGLIATLAKVRPLKSR